MPAASSTPSTRRRRHAGTGATGRSGPGAGAPGRGARRAAEGGTADDALEPSCVDLPECRVERLAHALAAFGRDPVVLLLRERGGLLVDRVQERPGCPGELLRLGRLLCGLGELAAGSVDLVVDEGAERWRQAPGAVHEVLQLAQAVPRRRARRQR